MNLLPKTREDFSKTEYWNAFFKKRGTKAFEWYGEYPELCGHLHKYIKPHDAVLVLGCGNSTLSADLYDVGYRNLVNIDISSVVIKQMENQHAKQRPELKFIQMDALNMTFETSQFNVVLDKGTLDALMPDDSPEVQERIMKMFSEVDRVLRLCGRWVCVSLLQDHVLHAILNFFPSKGWMVRICRCIEAERKTADGGDSSGLPVFVVVCTKMMKIPNSLPVLELLLSSDSKPERLASLEALADVVRQVQQAAMVCSRLGSSSVAGHGEVSLDLLKPGDLTPRFTVYVRDRPCVKESARKFAAFIVPQGRETEWLFGSQEGRESLQRTVGFDRLAIVTMHRDHVYPTLDEVKAEVTECILQVAPSGNTNKIPFLSVGEDVGERKVCLRTESPISGAVVVEEVKGEDDTNFRRLIFLSNPCVIQSEAKLKKVKSRRGNSKNVVDTGYLGCEHHLYMSVGVSLTLMNKPSSAKVLVVGLGGGGLVTFLHACFQQAHIAAVEIDPLMEKIATEYFGLPRDERIKLHFQDGVEFIANAAANGSVYDAILFDVDSKDPSQGLSCPPQQFLDNVVLQNVKTCIGDSGYFILNLVCRSEALRRKVKDQLADIFSSISSYKLQQDVNEVVLCSCRQLQNLEGVQKEIQTAGKKFNELVKEQKIQKNNAVDVTELVENLSILSV